MPNPSGDPKPTEAEGEPLNSENLDQTESEHIAQQMDPAAQEPVTDSESALQSEDWWSAVPPVAEWAKPTQHQSHSVCGSRSLEGVCHGGCLFLRTHKFVSLESRASSDRQRGTHRRAASILGPGASRILAKDGAIVFVTSRDPDLYCPEAPAVLANVAAEMLPRHAPTERNRNAIFPYSRPAGVNCAPACYRIRATLWTKTFLPPLDRAEVWIMFEKNAALLSDAPDVSAELNVNDWALETLRFVENLDQQVTSDPTSIPAYTKDGFERVQKAKADL
jgi:hypothetical protein